MDLIKNIAAVVGLMATTFGFLTAIFKPLRQSVINSFAHKSEYQTLIDDVKEIKTRQDEAIKKQDEAIEKLNEVEKRVLENECDRLKSELFSCGDRCRRGIILYPEEMGHIRGVYHKYNEVLHQNHDGTLEYEFILKYYNSQQINDGKNN